MKFFLSFILATFFFEPLYSQTDSITTPQGNLVVHPINHGSLALQWQGKNILIDPYGGASLYSTISPADIILITDIHGDHFHPETLKGLSLEKVTFVVPQAVADLLTKEKINANQIQVLNNGDKKELLDLKIEAVPMYNLPESPESRHPKGRGNGYILSSGTTRLYISGDTEDIPEMRQLKNINVAFVCMNLPYTMSVQQASEAVLEFEPLIVYPYHYRGEGGKLSNIEEFKAL
ncbi:MAG: MBL fold metallo-hydrolase, partial [Bacteroidota bacterium]|nr:MBL fold metallo-hydrolase [Bacteroidota bacterium]